MEKVRIASEASQFSVFAWLHSTGLQKLIIEIAITNRVEKTSLGQNLPHLVYISQATQSYYGVYRQQQNSMMSVSNATNTEKRTVIILLL